MRRRYVYGPGQDEPLVWYEGAGTADRRFLHADERGSIVAVSNSGGGTVAINSYDEFGIPGAGNVGRFQYTGQRWVPALGMYDYKARMYSPTLGRFMQTDPVGYDAGLNLYNYVGSDPINATDPGGLAAARPWVSETGCPEGTVWNWQVNACTPPDVIVTAGRPRGSGGMGGYSPGSGLSSPPRGMGPAETAPESGFVQDTGTPPNSKQCTAGGISFRAPADFNPRAIMNSGYWGGLPGSYFAVAHYGTYDFQRSVRADGGTTFYRQYTPISNMAVGFYLAGAGYSRGQASSISDTFAGSMSSNGATAKQATFRNLAYDVVEGKAKIVAILEAGRHEQHSASSLSSN